MSSSAPFSQPKHGPAERAHWDTIAALATAPSGSARGIVRVAGGDVVAVLAKCFSASDGQTLGGVRVPTRLDGHLELVDLGGRHLPCELYLWPTERSYCRCPMAEIHTLGSPPLLAAALRTVCRCGARGAAPGEFTLRAFLSGRIDLAQAEAVLGVIDAGGADDLEVALAQLAGGLSQPLLALRERLLEALAQLEAGLDFVEEDIEFISAAELDRQLEAAQQQVAALAGRMALRTDAVQSVRVVLRGLPNAGKSSLFNALVRQYGTAGAVPALVSPRAGTTRDYLRAKLAIGQVDCELIDTAGLEGETSPDGPTGAAQTLARQQIAQADLAIQCVDASQPARADQGPDAWPSPSGSTSVLHVLTKCDLPRSVDDAGLHEAAVVIETSAATGAGLATLADAICARVGQDGVRESAVVASTAQHCCESLQGAAANLVEARRLIATGSGEELVAAEVRAALHALGEVTGTVYTDDILERIFSRFCIGK